MLLIQSLCVGHHYTQTNTNNINKTTGGKTRTEHHFHAKIVADMTTRNSDRNNIQGNMLDITIRKHISMYLSFIWKTSSFVLILYVFVVIATGNCQNFTFCLEIVFLTCILCFIPRNRIPFLRKTPVGRNQTFSSQIFHSQ